MNRGKPARKPFGIVLASVVYTENPVIAQACQAKDPVLLQECAGFWRPAGNNLGPGRPGTACDPCVTVVKSLESCVLALSVGTAGMACGSASGGFERWLAQRRTWPNRARFGRTGGYVDAEGKVLGRLASDIAMILMGKASPHLHAPRRHGRFRHRDECREGRLDRQQVVAENVHLVHRSPRAAIGNGRAADGTTIRNLLLREAVRRMLPKNKLWSKDAVQVEDHMLGRTTIIRRNSPSQSNWASRS